MEQMRVLSAGLDAVSRQAIAAAVAARADMALVGEHACVANSTTIRDSLPDIAIIGVEGTPPDRLLREFNPSGRPAFVIVGSSPNDAVWAFETQAVAFLLRPIETARCTEALDRARRHVYQMDAVDLSSKLSDLLSASAQRPTVAGMERYTDRLTVSRGGRVMILPVRQVEWLAAEGAYVRVHSGGAEFLMRRTIGSLHARLDPRLFLRTHRSTIVNVERVVEIRREPNAGISLVLTTGVVIPVSKRRRDDVARRFGLDEG